MSGAAAVAESPSINTNENTATIPHPIEKTGGESFTNFDELEGMVGKKVVDGVVEDATQRAASRSPKKEPSEKPQQTDPKKPPVDTQPEKIKTYKVKAGDTELDLRSDAEIPVTVNGKTQFVKVADLLKDFSGRNDWDQRYSSHAKEKDAFTKERAAYQADRQTVQGFLTKLGELAKSEDPSMALVELAEAVGQDPAAVLANFRSQMDKHLESYSKMTPEQRAAIAKDEEIALYRKREERSKAKSTQNETVQRVQNQLNQVKKDFDMSEQDLVETYDAILKAGLYKNEDLVANPRLLGEIHQEWTARDQVWTALQDVTKDMPPEEMEQATQDLYEAISGKGLSQEDIAHVAAEVYGSKAAQNLSRKIRKSEPTNTSKPTAGQREAPWSFDHIE